MASTAVLVSRAEFDARVAAGERLEFDQGVIIERPMADSVHDWIKMELTHLLRLQLPRTAFVATESGFEVVADRLRIPDVAVCLRKPQLVRGERFQGPPDVAIEVISPGDKHRDVEAKIHLFLSNGTQSFWLVLPEHCKIRMHRQDGSIVEYGERDVLQGEQPIPGFHLRIAELFEGIS